MFFLPSLLAGTSFRSLGGQRESAGEYMLWVDEFWGQQLLVASPFISL